MAAGVVLQAQSHHSLGWGASSPEELLDRAAALSIGALALADVDSMAGVVDFVAAARARVIQPIPAATLTVPEGHLVLLPRGPAGWAALCRLLTRRHLGPGRATAAEALREMAGEGFVLAGTPAAALALPAGHRDALVGVLARAAARAARLMRAAAGARGLPAVASPGARMAARADLPTQRLLAAIHGLALVSTVPPERLAGPHDHLHSPAAMAARYQAAEIAGAREVALACRWSFPNGRRPRLPGSGSARPARDLAARCLAARCLAARCLAALRTKGLARHPAYVRRLARELRLVRQLGHCGHFLLVARIADAAAARGIPTIGRGSAADSAISWLLGITQVDPVAHDLLFERFLNPGRTDPPDFDLDFPSADRLGVIERAIADLGPERCAIISTHVTFRARAAFLETAKALGVPPAAAARVSRHLPSRLDGDARATLSGLVGGREIIARLDAHPGVWEAASRIIGKPRHLGSHPGGLVIAPGPITDLVALQRSAQGPPITQPEMVQVEKGLGLLKVDLLGNRSLGVLRDACGWLGHDWRTALATRHLAPTARIRQRLATGQTLGVFYVEIPAMRSLLCQLRPTDFMGLTAASSVIRPGVSESGMKDAYIRRRQGLEKPLYPHPILRRLLGETLGVMVYQEDVMKVARELGGLSWADANELRKASSTKRGRRAFVARAGERFVAGAISNGCTPAVAADLWRQMASFAGYAFCKAHSASYAQESMACLWLAAHEPAAFWAGVLANGGGYYGLSAYLEEARRQGVEPLPCDLNLSAANWQPERARADGPFTAVRPGLAGVRGLSSRTLEAILAGRPFAGVSDLLARTPCRGEEAAMLVAAGALDFTGRTRATLAVLAAKAFFRGPGGGGLVGGVPDPEIPRRAEWNPATRLLRERLALGCSPSAPPVSLVLPGVAGRVRIANLASMVDKMVWVVGHFVIARGHRTEGGDAMRFFTVEDETGLLECVAWPRAWRRLHKVLRQGAFWALRGRPRDRHDTLTLEVEGPHRLAPPAGGGALPDAGG